MFGQQQDLQTIGLQGVFVDAADCLDEGVTVSCHRYRTSQWPKGQ
jgi:hypothetical protein